MLDTWLLTAFGAESLVDTSTIGPLVMHLLVDLIALTAVVRGIYVRIYRWNPFVFAFYALNIVTFATCFVLQKVPIELGFALGLFAVFGILRYRTEPIEIRDLTYLFVVIGLSLLNSVGSGGVSVFDLLAMNAVIVGMTYAVEFRRRGDRLMAHALTYDNLELLHPGREDELADDIALRTGLRVVRTEIRSVDLLRDVAKVTIYCTPDARRTP